MHSLGDPPLPLTRLAQYCVQFQRDLPDSHTATLSGMTGRSCHVEASALVVRIQSELDKNNAVLDNGAKGAQEPRESSQQSLLILRIGHEADAVGEIAREGQHKKKKGKSWTNSQSSCVHLMDLCMWEGLDVAKALPSQDFSRQFL